MSNIKNAIVLSSAVAAITVASAASAQEVYVYGSLGATEKTHTIERNIGPNPPTLPVPDAGGVSTVSETGLSYLVGAGARMNIGDGPAFVGLEGYYSVENGKSRNINGILVTDLDLKARYGARLLAGVDVTEKFSVYGHGGIVFLDYDLTNSYTFAPPVRERSNDDSGFSYGVGASYRLTDSISAFVDLSKVAEIKFGGIPEVAGGTGRVNRNTLSTDTLSTGLRLSF